MSSLDWFTSVLIGASLGKSPGSDNLNFFEPVCSFLSSGCARKTRGSGRKDDDDPAVRDWSGQCGWCGNCRWSVFSRVLSKHQRVDGRGILSCASLTRTLRATSEDMALMIRVLHCFVWSRERSVSHACFTANTSRGVLGIGPAPLNLGYKHETVWMVPC